MEKKKVKDVRALMTTEQLFDSVDRSLVFARKNLEKGYPMDAAEDIIDARMNLYYLWKKLKK